MTAWLVGAAVGGWVSAALFALALRDCASRAIKNISFERTCGDKWRDMAYELAREVDEWRLHDA